MGGSIFSETTDSAWNLPDTINLDLADVEAGLRAAQPICTNDDASCFGFHNVFSSVNLSLEPAGFYNTKAEPTGLYSTKAEAHNGMPDFFGWGSLGSGLGMGSCGPVEQQAHDGLVPNCLTTNIKQEPAMANDALSPGSPPSSTSSYDVAVVPDAMQLIRPTHSGSSHSSGTSSVAVVPQASVTSLLLPPVAHHLLSSKAPST